MTTSAPSGTVTMGTGIRRDLHLAVLELALAQELAELVAGGSRALFLVVLVEGEARRARRHEELQWFYEKTPYFDERWRLYPVAREPRVANEGRSR